MNFILNSLKINLKNLLPKVVILSLFTIFIVLLCYIIQIIIGEIYGSEESRLRISIVNEDDNPQTNLMLNMILKNKEINKLILGEIVSYEEAKEKLINHETTAILKIPDGFINSVISNENKTVDVEMMSTNLLDTYMVSNLANSLSTAVLNTQSGISSTLQIMKDENININGYIVKSNLEYIKILLKYDNAFDENEIKYVETTSIVEHYIVCFAVFILFLTTPLFYKELNIRENRDVLKQISTISNKYVIHYLIQIVLISVVYLGIFIIMNMILDMEMSLGFIVQLLNCAVFLVLIQSLLFNMNAKYLGTVILNCLLHLIFLIMSGGIIPTIFLPKVISNFEMLSPITFIRDIILEGSTYMDIHLNGIIVAVNILILTILYYKMRKNIRWGGV